MKVVNLSDLKLTPDHISLLQKGMTFSPVANMDKFTVFKDVTLFLRKVFLHSLYDQKDSAAVAALPIDAEDQKALDILNSLLEENEGPSEIPTSIRRQANLRIRSQKMPPLSKNKWLNLFLDMLQTDLEKADWTQKSPDNLTDGKIPALNNLKKRNNIVIKKSDKGGNVVLLNQQDYEKEAKRLLNDQITYEKLGNNPFPALVQELNRKLMEAKDVGLLTVREFQHLHVWEFNVPTFYIIPKVH